MIHSIPINPERRFFGINITQGPRRSTNKAASTPSPNDRRLPSLFPISLHSCLLSFGYLPFDPLPLLLISGYKRVEVLQQTKRKSWVENSPSPEWFPAIAARYRRPGCGMIVESISSRGILAGHLINSRATRGLGRTRLEPISPAFGWYRSNWLYRSESRDLFHQIVRICSKKMEKDFRRCRYRLQLRTRRSQVGHQYTVCSSANLVSIEILVCSPRRHPCS
jgi:hypothetical protein